MNLKRLVTAAAILLNVVASSAAHAQYRIETICEELGPLVTKRDAYNAWAGAPTTPAQRYNCHPVYIKESPSQPPRTEQQQDQDEYAAVKESYSAKAQMHGYTGDEIVVYHFDRYGWAGSMQTPLWGALALDDSPSMREAVMDVQAQMHNWRRSKPLPQGAAHGRIEFWEKW